MSDIHIPPDSQLRLLGLSRRTLRSCVCGEDAPALKIDDPYLLASDYGAFVSLHKGKELRGCVGTCYATLPLHRTVADMTVAAASRDYRVAPIREGELHEIRIDISVLSPLESVEDPLSLEIGKHGLMVARGRRRGVFLPQVATQYGWDMETFLAQLCLKAGLAREAWRMADTKISSFTALVIEEGR